MPTKSPRAQPSYYVIRDTREQDGWDFSNSRSCLGTIDGTLKTGDYTLRGYEKLFTIERKGSLAEFARNLTQARFHRELERMNVMDSPYVFLEFDVADIYRWPEGSGIPKYQWSNIRVSSHFLTQRFLELSLMFPRVNWLFVGRHGHEVASSLFKRIVEKYAKPDA